jgi:hypothetical protein
MVKNNTFWATEIFRNMVTRQVVLHLRGDEQNMILKTTQNEIFLSGYALRNLLLLHKRYQPSLSI